MGAAGNKKPKKDKTSKHNKHVPAYMAEEVHQDVKDLEKKK